MSSFLPNPNDSFGYNGAVLPANISVVSPSMLLRPAPSGDWGTIRSYRNFSRLASTAKVYWEELLLEGGPGTNTFRARMGFAPRSFVGFGIGDDPTTSARRVDLYIRNGATIFNVNDIGNDEIALYALDCSNRKLWLGDVQNTNYTARVWSNAGDPTAGTGNCDTLPSLDVHLAASMVDEPSSILYCTGRNYLIYPAPSGFTPLDSIDTVTAVAWDAGLKNSAITLSNSNKTAATATAGRTVLASRIITAKAHFEVRVDTLGTGAADTLPQIGLGTVIKGGFLETGLAGADFAYRSDGAIRLAGVTQMTLASYTTGDVIGIEFDPATGKVWVAKNGTWLNSGNPAAGTGQVATLSTGFYWVPAVAPGANGQMTARFEAGDFTTTVSTDFAPVRNGTLAGGVYSDGNSGLIRTAVGSVIVPPVRERMAQRGLIR